jgi:hypothetical protein
MMISIPAFRKRPGLKSLFWLGIAISLLAPAASAQTYPISGVWIATDDLFPGSTKGACFTLKTIGIDALSFQPFPTLMIFSDNKRIEVSGNHHAERTIRSVPVVTNGRFRITETLGKRWPSLSNRTFLTLQIIDATTIEVTERNIITRFYKCSSSPLL